MSRRPPLPLSPRRLRPRRVAPPKTSCRTPPALSAQKTQPHGRFYVDSDQPHLLPNGYESISTELLALARRVSGEFGAGREGTPHAQLSSAQAAVRLHATASDITPPMFQRGRMYEVYSERRNERLRRRRDERKDWDLGISGGSEVTKRRVNAKRLPAAAATTTKSAKRSVGAGDTSAVRAAYTLRSSVKKASSTLSSSAVATKAVPRANVTGASAFTTPRRSVAGVDKRVGTRSCRRNY